MGGVAIVQEFNVIFREVQRSRQWWLWLTLVSGTVFAVVIFAYGIIEQIVLHRPFGSNPMSDTALVTTAVLVVLLMVVLDALFLGANLVTEVRPDGLHIRYFPFHLSFRRIPLENVTKVEAVTYSPIRDYGGWGIRWARTGKAYNPTGDRGVRIHYADGRHILIGSQRPEELAQAVQSVMH